MKLTIDSKLDQLSVKLLRILIAVEETRSTYKAAEKLYMSQSATARGLDKLRSILNDALFIRGKNGLESTVYCQQLLKRTPKLITSIVNTIQIDESFTAHSLTGNYHILLHSPFSLRYGSDLMARLINLAPNAKWSFTDWYNEAVYDLGAGNILLGIQYSNRDFPKSIIQSHLAQDEFCLLAKKDHPIKHENNVISLDELALWPFIHVTIPGWNHYRNQFQQLTDEYNITINNVCRTDDLGAAISLLSKSDCLLVATKEIAKQHNNLKMFKFDEELVHPDSSIVACYTQREKDSPLISWLIEQIKLVLKYPSDSTNI